MASAGTCYNNPAGQVFYYTVPVNGWNTITYYGGASGSSVGQQQLNAQQHQAALNWQVSAEQMVQLQKSLQAQMDRINEDKYDRLNRNINVILKAAAKGEYVTKNEQKRILALAG